MGDSFLQKFFSVLKCGVCGKSYEADDVKIVGHEDDLWFISAHCNACHTQGLIIALVERGESEEARTDLMDGEQVRFVEKEAVCTDDVVDMHNFLKEFDGDFVSLFAKE